MLPGTYFLASKGEFIPFATNGGQDVLRCEQPARRRWVGAGRRSPRAAGVDPVRGAPLARRLQQSPAAFGFEMDPRKSRAFLSLLPKKFANAWIPGLQSSERTSQSRLAALVLVVSYALLLLCAIAGRVLVKPARRDGIPLSVPVTYTVMSFCVLWQSAHWPLLRTHSCRVRSGVGGADSRRSGSTAGRVAWAAKIKGGCEPGRGGVHTSETEGCSRLYKRMRSRRVGDVQS